MKSYLHVCVMPPVDQGCCALQLGLDFFLGPLKDLLQAVTSLHCQRSAQGTLLNITMAAFVTARSMQDYSSPACCLW